MLNDQLANVLSAIIIYEKVGKKEFIIQPISKIIRRVLTILQEHGYVGELEEISTAKGGIAKLNLLGNLNKCGVIKPRFSIDKYDFERFEKRYLPANGVGILIISTPYGLMTHEQAKEKKIGGRLIAYCY